MPSFPSYDCFNSLYLLRLFTTAIYIIITAELPRTNMDPITTRVISLISIYLSDIKNFLIKTYMRFEE
jgi:hypothetical protein